MLGPEREEEGGDCLSQGFLSRLFCFLAFFFALRTNSRATWSR